MTIKGAAGEQMERFYHGTSSVVAAQAGKLIEPHSSLPAWHQAKRPVNSSATDPSYAYATPDPSNAWDYAEKSWNTNAKGVPRVYEVEPTGDHEPDPQHDAAGNSRGNFATDRRSSAPWRVIGEVPMPEHMGTVEDWR